MSISSNQETEEKVNDSDNKQSVRWVYKEENKWIDYDAATTKQLEDNLNAQNTVKKKLKVTVLLSKGAYFGLEENRKKYKVLIYLNREMDPPIIEKAIQTENKSYSNQIINVTRFPSLDWNGSDEDELEIANYECQHKWYYNNNDEWIQYDPITSKQIELALNKESKYVILNKSAFASPNVKNLYRVKFNHDSIPSEATQHQLINARGKEKETEIKYQAIQQNNDQQKTSSNADETDEIMTMIMITKHYLRPLSMKWWIQQKEMSPNDLPKCDICFEDFEQENFLGYWVRRKIRFKLQTLKKWMTNVLQLPQYIDIFIDHGLDDLDIFKNITINTLTAIGIDNMEHKSKILETISKLHDNASLSSHQETEVISCKRIAIQLSKCGGQHFFHSECIARHLAPKRKCAVCSITYGVQIGNQPDGIMKVRHHKGTDVASQGTENKGRGSIEIIHRFPAGIQGPAHQNPGKRYPGRSEYIYLPRTSKGIEVLGLIRVGWERKLLYTIGRSVTRSMDNAIIWNGIHFKTSRYGGVQNYGWPDKTYLERVKDEFKQKGITIDDIPNRYRQKSK